MPPSTPMEEYVEPKEATVKAAGEGEKGESCFCGKEINEHWVRCDNEENCKGSSWYHYSCVGFTERDNVEGRPFVCKFCKDDLANE